MTPGIRRLLDRGPDAAKNVEMSSLNQKMIGELRAIESSGSPGFLGELIDLYLKEAVAHLARLRDALTTKDAPVLERTAHTLKGSSGNLGAMTLSRMCADLQDFGHTPDWTRVAEILPRLEIEFEAVKADLLAEKGRS
jgi:HPt (histidine-containing phosphotransfer) domain-containing protein